MGDAGRGRAGLDRDLVVAVLAGSGPTELSSGYLVAPDLVVTAMHGLHRQDDDRPAVPVRVVRRDGRQHAVVKLIVGSPELDVAVLRLQPGSAPDAPRAEFGRLDRSSADAFVGCVFIGYPRWEVDPNTRDRTSRQVEGVIRSADGEEGGYLLLHDLLLAGLPVKVGDWRGVSGALVFHDGAAIGVVVEQHAYQGTSSFRILPIESVLAQRNGSALATELGIAGPGALRRIGGSSHSLIEHVSQLTPDGELPTARSASAVLAGVVGSAYTGDADVYVAREVDAALQQDLRAHQFVVVIGPSAAGKSRTTFEAVRQLWPDHRWLQPRSATSVGPAIAAAPDQPAVLWLDDLERYVADDGGLTGANLARFLSRPDRRVVATLRRERVPSFEAMTDAAKTLAGLLGQACRREFPMLPSTDETLSAQQAYPAEAFRLRLQIGEVLLAGPALVRRIAQREHVNGAELVRSAIDLESVGLPPPYPSGALGALAAHYVGLREPGYDAERFDLGDALAWATTAGSGVLAPLVVAGPDRYRAADYLVSTAAGEVGSIPDTAWRAAIRWATTPAGAFNICVRALARGRKDIAEEAARRVRSLGGDQLPPGVAAAVAGVLGEALHRAGDDEQALLELAGAVDGPDPWRAHALELRGDIHAGGGAPADALRDYTAAIGTGHRHTIDSCALKRADLLATGAPAEEAVDAYEEALTVTVDPDDRLRVWCRIAELWSSAGLHDRAEGTFTRAASSEPDAPLRDRYLTNAGAQAIHAGHATAAIEQLRAARRAAAPDDRATVALAWLVESGAYACDADEREAALESARALDAGRPSQFAAIELTKLTRRTADVDGSLRLLEQAAAGPDPHLRLDASVRRIEMLSAEKRHDEAGRAAAAVLEPFESLLSPDHYLFLGQVLEKAGTVDLAVSAFRHAEIAANTDASISAMLEHARLEHDAGHAAEAVALLERALAEGRGDGRDQAALALARLLHEGQEETRALAMLDEVLPAATWLRPELLFERVVILCSLDRDDEAREPLRELVEVSDPSIRAHSLEMWARIEERADPDAAVEIFRMLVEVEHDHSAAYAGFRLGEWHLAHGETDRALEVLRRSAALRSTDSGNAMQRLVTELERQGCDAEAREELDRYLDSTPDAPAVMFVRVARMHAESGGKPLTTLRRFSQALERAVEEGQPQWVGEAGSQVFAVAMGQGDNALADNALLLMRTHGDPQARCYAEYYTAERLIKEGLVGDAVVHLESAASLDIDPYAGHAWRRLADHYLGKGDIERANVARSKMASRGSLSDALRAELVDAAGALLADDRPRAREIAERVRSLAPDEDIRGRATFVLSDLLVRDGKPEEAKRALQEFVAAEAEDTRHQALLALAAIDLDADPGCVPTLLGGLEDAHCAHGARASTLVGAALTVLGRDDDARAAFTRTLASRWCDDTARRQARYYLAVYAEQECADVEDDWRAVIDWTAPDDITMSASSMLVECLAERGDSDGIRSAVVPWTTVDHEQAPMFVRYATALADLIDGSARDAALQLGALVETDDEDVRDSASLWLGRAHARLGNTELARKALTTATRSGQQSVAAKARQAIASLDE